MLNLLSVSSCGGLEESKMMPYRCAGLISLSEEVLRRGRPRNERLGTRRCPPYGSPWLVPLSLFILIRFARDGCREDREGGMQFGAFGRHFRK